MNSKLKNISLFSFAVLSLFACSKENMTDDSPVEIVISGDGETKVTGNSFDLGDKVGIYMYNDESYIYDNVVFYKTATGFASEERMFYRTEGDVSFFAYYPYSEESPVTPGTDFVWKIKENQNLNNGYADSDLMSVTEIVPSGTNPVELIMQHKMSAIDIVFIPGAGYTPEKILQSDISVKINNVVVNTIVNTATGEVTSNGEPANIEPKCSMQISGETVTGISSIIAPQIIPEGTRLLSVKVNGVDYYYETGADLTLLSGQKALFKLKVSDREVDFYSDIVAWTDNDPISGDLTEGEESVTDIDGNVYGVITVGSQQWLDSDLKTLKLNNGTAIAMGTMMDFMRGSNPIYALSEINGTSHVLYNYPAVATGTLCPEGWRVPTYDEIKALITFLGSSTAGKATKSTSGWSDGTNELSEYQGDGTTEMNILPVGYAKASAYGQLDGRNKTAKIWCSAPESFGYAYSFQWDYNTSTIKEDYRTDVKDAISVRCIKAN